MNIKKIVKSRLLFVVTAILLVFAATSALAAKTTSCSPLNLIGTAWYGTLQELSSGGPVQLKVIITDVKQVGDTSYIPKGYISYKYKTVVRNIKLSEKGSFIHTYDSGIDIIFFFSDGNPDSTHISGGYINNKIQVAWFVFPKCHYTDSGDLVPVA